MTLTQKICDLKFGSPCAVVVFGLNADEAEADAVGRITAGETVHHGAQGDVGVFVLVASEHSTFGCHHSDHFKRLATNPHLLADGVARRKEFRP